MTKVLLTGASGFVGRHCLQLLISKGYEVHALSRRPPSIDESASTWHELDLLKPGCAAELLRRVRPDFLLHLAWYAAPGKFWEARENIDWVRASLELLQEFADSGGKRIVAAGTCAEYDYTSGECKENSTALIPATLYGASKHAVERILHFASPRIGLSSAWGRVFFLYGPYEHPLRIVAYVVQSLLRGEPAFCSDGGQILDFIHVEDAASAFVFLLESEVQGPVNLGSGVPVVLRDMLQEIGRQLGRPELIQYGERNSSSRLHRLWADTSRLVNEVSWRPRYDLPSGIEHTIKWWRDHLCHPIQPARK